MQGHIFEDHYIYGRQFNTKIAVKMIVKQRPITPKVSPLWIYHSEIYFVSEDNQVLYISFHGGISRVDIIRIQWSNQEDNLSYRDLIEKFAETKKQVWNQYVYEQEYDLTQQEKEFEFIQIQELAREYASTPYTTDNNNCNHATKWLINQINPKFMSLSNYKQLLNIFSTKLCNPRNCRLLENYMI